MTKKTKRTLAKTKKKASGTRTANKATKIKRASSPRRSRTTRESFDDRVRRIALEAARDVTENKKLTLKAEMDYSMAMGIKSAMEETFDVEILGDSAQEMVGGTIEDWVDYMRLLLNKD